MKVRPFILSSLLILFSLRAATLAHATNVPPQGVIKHVIVIQENRTPDNLFYLDQTLVDRGADVRPPVTPKCKPPGQSAYDVPLTLAPFDACFSPNHGHGSWKKMWHNGAMDGACNITVAYPFQGPPPITCTMPHPQYTYASNADHNLDPYFQIAEHYAFCNYCFQTNQGPSFPAHQFLFGGDLGAQMLRRRSKFAQVVRG